MEALVSGQAARVVFIEGMNVSYIEADNPQSFHPIPHSDIYAVLGGATDVERINVQSHQDVYGRLLEKYNFDRCFRMLDIAISETEDSQTRRLAAEVFTEMASDHKTNESIRNYTFAYFNSDIYFPADMVELYEGNEFFVNFLSELVDCQIHILSFDEALKKSFSNNLIDQDIAAEFKHRAIDSGLFRKIVEAKRAGKKVEDAVLQGYLELQDITSSRQILQDWTKEFLAQKSKRSLKQLESDFDNYSASDYQPREHEDRNHYEVYLAIQRQQESIVEKLTAGEHPIARRFAAQMIKSQIANGDAGYAAKSLTKLATAARRLGLHSIELEWAKWATELSPDDGFAKGMLADTYLGLFRFLDAERAFEAAVSLGEDEFGALGLARLQRLSGDPVAALAALEKIKAKQADNSPHAVYVWQSYCGTLKDLYRFNEALESIEQSLGIFPDDSSLMCTRAHILSDSGSLDEALAAYGDIISKHNDEAAPRCGKAWVLFKSGRLTDALAEFEEVIRKFPNEVAGHIGRATVIREKGEHEIALAAFVSASKRFPYSPSTFCGIAETYREMGKLSDALSSYDEAIRRFDMEIVARNGRANILKTMGNFQQALQEYDKNVKDFPYNLYALSGRADLLRRLGNYDDANSAYDVIIERHPKESHAKVSKSAILVAQKQFSEAFELLSDRPPKTENEWFGFHIRGIAALSQNNFEDAIAIFEKGVEASPFYRQRGHFRTALAAAKIRMRDYSGASRLLAHPQDPISKLLLVHSLAEEGKSNEAANAFAKVNDVIEGAVGLLRIELGARYKLTNSTPKHDELWIFEREAEAFLQAA